MLELNNCTAALLRQSPSALKRCLRSQKTVKLSIKFTDWAARVPLSHLLSIISLLNLSSPRSTVGRGPLKNTLVSKHWTLFSRSINSCFRTSDCCSRAPVCTMRYFTVGCSSAIFRIYLFIFFGNIRHHLWNREPPSATISVWGSVVRSFCSLLVCGLVSYLSLVVEDEPSFVDSGSWESGANLFFSWIPVSRVGPQWFFSLVLGLKSWWQRRSTSILTLCWVLPVECPIPYPGEVVHLLELQFTAINIGLILLGGASQLLAGPLLFVVLSHQ